MTRNSRTRRYFRSHLRHRGLLMAVSSLILIGGVACVDVADPYDTRIDPATTIFRLRAPTRSIVIAAGESLPIPLTAVNINGDTLSPPEDLIVDWSSQDVTKVTVDSTGTLQGLASTARTFVRVIARGTSQGVTVADTINVSVTPIRYPVTALRLIQLDSTGVGRGGLAAEQPRVWVRALDAHGDSVTGVFVQAVVDNGGTLSAASFPFGDDGLVSRVNSASSQLGTFWVRAIALVYGELLVDSIPYRTLYPASFTRTINVLAPPSGPVYQTVPGHIQVQPCARITFNWTVATGSLAGPIDIIFDGPAQTETCSGTGGSTNALNVAPRTNVTRRFRTPGEYRWQAFYAGTTTPIPTISGSFTVAVAP